MKMQASSLAVAAAEHLGGPDAIGRKVDSDAEMAMAVVPAQNSMPLLASLDARSFHVGPRLQLVTGAGCMNRMTMRYLRVQFR